MAIGEICNREVVIIAPTATVSEAASLMREYHVGDLVVVEEVHGKRRPMGILTDRDIVIEVLAKLIDPGLLMVGDVISPGLATVREDEAVFETMRYMQSRGVRRLPVIDDEGWLLGIVTLDDFLQLLADELKALAQLTVRERQQESAVRK